MALDLKARPLSSDVYKVVNQIRDAANKLRRLEKALGITAEQAERAFQNNRAWHRKHPSEDGTIRDGDVPF